MVDGWKEGREKGRRKKAGRLAEMLEKGAGLRPGGREEAKESGHSDLNHLFL